MKKVLVPLLVALFLIGGYSAYSAKRPTPAPVKHPHSVKVVSHPPTVPELLTLVNGERAKAGVAPLRESNLLDQSAQLKSTDEQTYHYFGHINPATGKHGYSYVADTGEHCTYVSENLVQNVHVDNGKEFDNTAQGTVNAWMQSSAHKAALLDPRYELTGFGIAGTYVTEHFCDL